MQLEKPETMDDEKLLNDLIYWIRVGRNEGGLHGEEHTHLRSLCREVRIRKLLSVTEDHDTADKH